jgi:hypothetical protein
MAFANMMTIERSVPGAAHSEGLTFGAIESLQSVAINLIKVE